MHQDEVPKYRKRRNGKKPFAIEYRNKPNTEGYRLFGDEWTVLKRYKTAAQRDEAMKSLSVGGIGFSSIRGDSCFEYRKIG